MQEARGGGKSEANVALRVDAVSAKVLTESDQEDIRAQVVVSGGGGVCCNPKNRRRSFGLVSVAFVDHNRHGVNVDSSSEPGRRGRRWKMAATD